MIQRFVRQPAEISSLRSLCRQPRLPMNRPRCGVASMVENGVTRFCRGNVHASSLVRWITSFGQDGSYFRFILEKEVPCVSHSCSGRLTCRGKIGPFPIIVLHMLSRLCSLLIAKQPSDNVERHIDAGRYPGRKDDFAVVHIALCRTKPGVGSQGT